MISVGLTGNVASGKSEVSRMWGATGVPVISADALARDAVRPGSPGLNSIVGTFGPDVLALDGTLDRDRMRDEVFGDPAARQRLEEIIHPIVWQLRSEWLRERRDEGAALVVSEIPLLFETGREGDFDLVVFVDAPDDVRLARMVEYRGLSEEQGRRIMAAQMAPDQKRPRADIVIPNVGTLEDLERNAKAALDRIRSAGPAATMRIDMHLHTVGSWDSLSDPERVLETALERGFHRIAITDHNRVHVGLRMAERYPDQIIPGEEVKTAEGIDVIGLYLTDEIPQGTPAQETIHQIRVQGGIPYLPHPYAGGKGGGGKYAEELGPLCDVIEAFNARLHDPAMNEKAVDLAMRHGKVIGAGSDAHTIGELGNAWVDLPVHANEPAALLAALADARPSGREASQLVHLGSTWAKVRKKLPGAPGSGWAR
jgi:dephospho-CoA kinase